MVLGQAMESSAGDPTKAGTIRTEFFYDPFIAGDHAFHANRFYDIAQNLPEVNYYLMNTGSIGEGYHVKKIDVGHTMSILDSMARGGLEDWIDSPSGFKVPTSIRTVDDIMVHPERLYSAAEFDAKQKELNKIRYEAIEKVGPNLNGKVKKIFQKV
jgi:phosphoenolpyruvate carboxykinase (ATP)